MKNILTTSLFLLFAAMIHGQAGIQLYTGLVQGANRDMNVTPSKMHHNGYTIGADVLLNEGNMYLILGGQYARMGFMPDEEQQYFSHDLDMQWFKLRTGLGFTLVQAGDNFRISAKTIGIINVISNYPENHLPQPYNQFNSATAAAAGALGIEYQKFGVFLEYEHGFFNAVNKVKGTEFDFLSLYLSFKI